MPTDLEYFYESKLDRTNIKDFCESLPSYLQSKFEQCNHTKIIWVNVLQGYRGPSHLCNNGSGDSEALESSNGIQEIKFWWGARKDLIPVPVIGTISFFTGRVVQTVQGQLDWSSLYFDSKTGECLSHNKDVAASKLNEIGRQLFDNGKFSEAKEYFNNAYTHSSNKANYDVYKDNRDKAKAELDAINLNSQGDNLFNQGRYHEAHNKYHEAYDKSQVSTQYNKYSTNRDKAKAELDAINLNSQGDNLFNQGKYHEAHNKYHEAYDKSQITKEKNIYAICKDKAKAELNAIELKELGDQEFNAGRYDSAKDKYQQACNKSSVAANKTTYTNCISKAQVELDAIELNEQGNTLFASGNFSAAKDKYQQAYDISEVAKKNDNFFNKLFYGPHEYKKNKDKAQTELDAIAFSDQANILLNQGKFTEAIIKYQAAYDKTQIFNQRDQYKSNRDLIQAKIYNKEGYQCLSEANAEGDLDVKILKYKNAQEKFKKAINIRPSSDVYRSSLAKAKAEIDAINLNSQGDNFFNQSKYHEAHNKYQEAYDKSQITKEKNIYAINQEKAQTIINKLSKLETLWNNAWKAENDTEDDRSKEAGEFFQEVLRESKDGLKIVPNDPKFKQYATLASLKIEGNELFNEGLESQQYGVELLQEAQALKQQQKYELANSKFYEAKEKFSNAQEKFEIGSNKDQRFVSCVELVQEQLNEVMESIKSTGQHTLASGLSNLDINISNSSYLENDSIEVNAAGEHNNYYVQI